MQITLMRRIAFCAGHRLLGHEGKCANLHGHNYVAEIHVSGSQRDDVGRIVDFAVIKQLFKDWIDANWDHGVIVGADDKELIDALAGLETRRTFVMPYNPTAENMALYLLTEVGPRLLSNIDGYDLRLVRVVIWETENSSATAEAGVDDQIVSFTAGPGSRFVQET